MGKTTINAIFEDLKVNMEIDSPILSDSSDLLTKALVNLIEESGQTESFWALILKAVATSYNFELAMPLDDDDYVAILNQLIGELHEQKLLT